MAMVNIHAAKTNLSRLLEQVERGEEIIIARAGRPVAVLTRYSGASIAGAMQSGTAAAGEKRAGEAGTAGPGAMGAGGAGTKRSNTTPASTDDDRAALKMIGIFE